MPRQSRRPPVGITRFNYWHLEICQPRDEQTLMFRRHFSSQADEGETHLAERFVRHLHGPCGEPSCRLDRKLARSPRRSVELALSGYIEDSREWSRNKLAQQALKSLAPARRATMREFATKQHDQWRQDLDTIIGRIREDLEQFEQMIPKGPGSAVKMLVETGYSAKRKIWQEYATQALALFGRGPTTLAITIGAAERATAGRLRARLDLRNLSAEEQAYVVHWFRHAARNLIRYRNGDLALPFEHPSCADTCRDTVRPALRS